FTTPRQHFGSAACSCSKANSTAKCLYLSIPNLHEIPRDRPTASYLLYPPVKVRTAVQARAQTKERSLRRHSLLRCRSASPAKPAGPSLLRRSPTSSLQRALSPTGRVPMVWVAEPT